MLKSILPLSCPLTKSIPYNPCNCMDSNTDKCIGFLHFKVTVWIFKSYFSQSVKFTNYLKNNYSINLKPVHIVILYKNSSEEFGTGHYIWSKGSILVLE